MECFEAESMLIDYIDAQLPAAQQKVLEQHLRECETCRHALEEYKQLFSSISENKTEKPGPALKEKFDIMLQSELNIDATTHILKDPEAGRVIPLKQKPLWLRIAASIILVALGVLAGMQLKPGGTGSTATELADLKTEVTEMKEAMLFNMLNEESASERIKAVSYAEGISNPDHRIISALLATMNEDKNVNVRLAALYAVSRYTGISDSLIASLGKQTEPLMQIALINILTEKKETKAIGPIRDLMQDKKTLQPVKDIAQKGLNLL